ncbi:hypothetical protein KCP74_04950 [Salmonella enterica subsp. enterica]|nr:hypothetical protein KCP74_04950 [Salmonella enterica subsp. enterica]
MRNSDRWLLLLRCRCTRLQSALVSSSVQRSGTTPWLPPARSCVKPAAALYAAGEVLLQLANQLPQISRALQARATNRSKLVRASLAECHSCGLVVDPGAGKLPCKLAAGRNGFHIRRHF